MNHPLKNPPRSNFIFLPASSHLQVFQNPFIGNPHLCHNKYRHRQWLQNKPDSKPRRRYRDGGISTFSEKFPKTKF